MIFILHYVLFGGALPAATVFLANYLQTYSRASMSEIGALLKLPSLLGLGLAPLLCSLADRHQAHRRYLVAGLATMALGFGSLAIGPFFPDFSLGPHHRLAWWLSVAGVVVGSSAMGVVYPLADALAVNGAEMSGLDWGRYRLWGVVGWGALGALASHLNELPQLGLPPYVAAMLQLVLLLSLEILLVAVWPAHRFVMYGKQPVAPSPQVQEQVVATQGGAAAAVDFEKKLQQVDTKNHISQWALLKFMARRDRRLLADALLLATIGFVSTCHLAFFFLHLKQVCAQQRPESLASSFATLSSGLLVMHSLVEILTFLAMPRLTRALGRAGSVALCASSFLLMQLYHATLLARWPLYWALPVQGLEGLGTALMYTLVKDTAMDAVDRVGVHLPELVARGLVSRGTEPLELKARLRATMQGLMTSGACGGLGGILGTLTGGLILDWTGQNFAALWSVCVALGLSVALLYPWFLFVAWPRIQQRALKTSQPCAIAAFK